LLCTVALGVGHRIMVTAVNHLGHDVPADVVGLLWVVSYIVNT